MTASPPIGPLRFSPRAMATVLLLAWLPVLFFVDHWPAPALLQPETGAVHSHIEHSHGSDAGAAHVEHGHGGAADGVGGAAVVGPPADVVPLHPPRIAPSGGAPALRILTTNAPIPPPPR